MYYLYWMWLLCFNLLKMILSSMLLWLFEQLNTFFADIVYICFLLYWHDQSTVQLALNFLSPESLPESVRLAQEIRCLPNGHLAKLKMLEVCCGLANSNLIYTNYWERKWKLFSINDTGKKDLLICSKFCC